MRSANAKTPPPGARSGSTRPGRTPTWVFLVSGVVGGLLFVLALHLWEARRAGPDEPSEPSLPTVYADVLDTEEISVFLAPGEDGDDGHPSVAVKLGDQTWYLSHPDPGSSITEKTAAWNRFAAAYEVVSAGILETVERIRDAEPDRRIGVIRTLGDDFDVPMSVIDFVQEALLDAEIQRVFVVPLLPAAPARPRPE